MITGLDHIVLTVRSIKKTTAFYALLGMKPVRLGGNHHALLFGSHKINLHEYGRERSPHALHPTPGSADLCFLVNLAPGALSETLKSHNIPVVEGPVRRSGAAGPILSFYIRDPDGNMIELAVPQQPAQPSPAF